VFLVLLGFAGNKQFEWSSGADRGKALYILCCIIFGTLRPFVSGVGPVELTCESRVIRFWGQFPNQGKDPVLIVHIQVLSKPKRQGTPGSSALEGDFRVSFLWLRSPLRAA
jgi:hypothetical protein